MAKMTKKEWKLRFERWATQKLFQDIIELRSNEDCKKEVKKDGDTQLFQSENRAASTSSN